ncbi:MAG: polyprenyl synthetase family protein [Anaerolineae bacterium]|nr:polyprenyl synthetase family protein [Anaerolineae bacterium]
MIAPQQTRSALDALYDLILTRLFTIESKGELPATLEQLCCAARTQDDALPLALLPVWSYAAVGGHDWQQAVGVAAAWRALHLAGKLLNDAADGRPSALLPDEPVTSLLNAGVSLVFLAQAILVVESPEPGETSPGCIPPDVALVLQAEFAHAGLRAAAGQHTRLKSGAKWSLADYQAAVARRSGGPFALATRAGALLMQGELAGAGERRGVWPAQVQALTDYGHHLGSMLQLADDFNGIWRPRGRSDLASGKRTWPLLYAEALAARRADQRARLVALVRRAPDDPAAEEAARSLLVRLDVPLAMILAAEEKRRLAEAALERLADSEARQALVGLVRRIALAPQEMQP